MGEQGDDEENELEQPDGDRDALDRHVAVMSAIARERRHDQRSVKGAGTPMRLPTPARPANSVKSAPRQVTISVADRKPRPAAAELLLDQLGVSLAGHEAEPDGQLLHDIENRDQDELQQQEAIAPLGAALRRRDHAARIGVGQHDHNAGAGDGEEAAPAEGGRSESVDGHGVETQRGRGEPFSIGDRARDRAQPARPKIGMISISKPRHYAAAPRLGCCPLHHASRGPPSPRFVSAWEDKAAAGLSSPISRSEMGEGDRATAR